MHGYNILYGGDLNENDNFVLGKLIMRGYNKFYGGDLYDNEIFKAGKIFTLSFWIEGLT